VNIRVYSHIREDTHGYIWSDVLGILLNVNRKVNEHRMID
jgi:hypothetical protein